jgi:hypothetical protein
MANKVATTVRYIGTFDRIKNEGSPLPYPEHPAGVYLYVSEFGKEVREALRWTDPELTNDIFVTIDENMVVQMSVEDNKQDFLGRPNRANLSPYFPMYPNLRTYQVKGLPAGTDLKGHIWNAAKTFEPPPPPPIIVSPVQARLALSRVGKLAAVEAACAADPELSIWFEYATSWDSSNPLVDQLGTAIGLTHDEMLGLFQAASQIVA